MGFLKRLVLLCAVLSACTSVYAAPFSGNIIFNNSADSSIGPKEANFSNFFRDKGEFHYWNKFKPLNMLSGSELFDPKKKSSKLDPTTKSSPSVYSISLTQNSIEDTANKTWEQMHKENSNRADFLYAYAMYLKSTNEFAQALESLDRAIAIDPNYALGYYLKGDIYRQIGRYKEALWSYIATIKINPYCTDAYFNIAKMFEEYNQYEEALEFYSFAYATSPSDIEIRNSIIRLQRQIAKI